MYSHFLDEHCHGHHKNVGTPEDPATALKGENIYFFIIRSAIGGHICAWNREVRKIKKRYGADASLLTRILYNKMTFYFMIHSSICAAIYYFLGWNSLKYQFVYTLWGIWYIEQINYIEHYGIIREKDQNGIYESITQWHSWNSVSSPALFRIQRHSDHHSHSFRPYQILRRFDDAPWHPFEYLHSLFISPIPWLWFYTIDKRVDALRDYVKGKQGNKTCFTNLMELTEHDKKVKMVGYGYLVFLLFLFTYLSFFTTIFHM